MNIWYWICGRCRRLFGMKPRLYGTWTIEPAEELRVIVGLNVEEELTQCLIEEINKERNE